MKAEIVSVGTELLVGSILNTNAQFLSRQLAENALDVYRQTTVGDNPDRIVVCFKEAVDRADLVIVSGGLGPTEDDVTAMALARFLDQPLVLHKPTYNAILQRLRIRGLRMTKMIERQCWIPQGSITLPNPNGTAPGILSETTKNGTTKWLLLLPGPPRELEPMFVNHALPALRKQMKLKTGHFVIKSVRISGLIEAQVAQKVTGLLKMRPPLTVGIYAKPGEVELKIMSKANSPGKATQAALKIEKKIKRLFGKKVYGVDEDTLPSATMRLLLKNKITVSTAESCTGGLISSLLTDVPDSSRAFKGGIIAYDTAVKTNILGIDRKKLKNEDVVSKFVAQELAKSARNFFKTNLGIGITGNAGPSTGDSKKPVGTVFIAIAGKKNTTTKEFRFIGSRTEIKRRAAHEAIDLLRLNLL